MKHPCYRNLLLFKTIYEYSIHSQENNEQKTFYFFPLESLHITKDATNATQLFLE